MPCSFWTATRFPQGTAWSIAKLHVGSFFEVTAPERAALFALLDRAKQRVAQQQRPDGYDVCINDGTAAGQTAPHLHMHLIPRYKADQSDPCGGARRVTPEKANY